MTVPILPFVVSTSGYNSPDVDWSDPIIDPYPVAGICRASLGTPEWMGTVNAATDQSFPKYWPQWDRLRLPRAAYPFFYNGVGGADQARWFVNRVMAAGGFHPCDRIVCDAEIAANLSLKEILDFFTQVAVLVPHVPFKNYLLYSRAELLNPLKTDTLTYAQKDYLRRLRQYPAGYPDNVAGMDFAELVEWYRPDPAKYGPTVLVQYQASATVPGISKPGYMSVECNAIDPAYLAEWQKDVADFYGAAPTTPDVISIPWSGVKVTRGRRFDTDIQVVEIARAVIREGRVDCRPGDCRTVDQVVGDIVSNGGDFDAVNCLPIGLLASDGKIISHQADSEPALGFNADNSPEISHTKTSWPNSVGLKRYLVVAGSINSNTSDAWNTRDPRTIYGVKPDGSLLIMSVKGRQDGQLGHDLFQAARTMIEFGAVTAADGDGGKSTQIRVADKHFTGVPLPDVVADFVAIVVKPGGIPMAKYKCTVTWPSGASVRPEPSTSNSGISVYPDGAVFYASELLADADTPADTNKQWAKIENDPINGTKYAGNFVAVKYPASSGAIDRCLVEDTSVTPPPPSGATIDHIEVVYTDGTRQNFVPQ